MDFIKKLSPNYTSGRNWQRIKKVVIHWIGMGTADSAANWFSSTNAGTSAHYIIGNVNSYQCVEEKNTAWHAGNWDMNLQSIGIEHEATPDMPPTETVYKKSAELVADICKRYDIPIDREHIIGHNEVKATACPGTIDIDRIIFMAKGDEMNELEVCLTEKFRYKKERNECIESRQKEGEEHAKTIRDKDSLIEQQQRANQELTTNLIGMGGDIDDLKEDKSRLASQLRALEVSSEEDIVELERLLEAEEDESEECRELLKTCRRELEELKSNKGLLSFSWSARFWSLFRGVNT